MSEPSSSAGAESARHALELLELGDAFFELDRGWRIIRVNGRQEQLSRKPRTETLGRTFADVWPELATPRSLYWRELERCMNDRVPVQFEELYAPLAMWTGVTAYPVSDGGIAVFFRDITSSKRTEIQAGRQAAEVEAILASAADGILVYDVTGRILRSNAAAARLLGDEARASALPAAERPASAGVTWLLEDGSPVAWHDLPPVRAARLGERHAGVVLRLQAPEGERWLSVNAAPLSVGGAHVGAVASIADITLRKRREAHQALLAALADDFARLSTEAEITAAAGARLAAHLGVSSCTIVDVEQGVASLRAAFVAPGRKPLPPTFRVSEWLGDELLALARQGRTIVVGDARADPRVDAARCDALGVRSGIIVPFQRGGAWRHSFGVGSTAPRDWRDDEVLLVQEVASRFFPRVERARAEEALRDSEGRYRSLFENSLDAVYLTRTDGTILDANPAACRMHAMSVEEIRQRGRDGLVVNDTRQAAALGERAATGHVRSEATDFRKDGTLFPVEMESVIVDPAEGTAFVISRDITERKRAEDALRESEQRFAVMFRRSPVAKLWARLPEEIVEDVSDTWVELTGVPREEAIGRTTWQLGLFEEGPRQRFCDHLQAHGLAQGELSVATRANGVRTVFARAETVAFAGSTYMLAAIEDVTDRKAAEAALREADRRKDEFLGMLSHELRNPLAPIRNSLYILDRPDASPEQARRARDVANRQVAHVTRIVDDLLDVTRIARGKIELRRTDLDLAALVRRTAEDHRELMRDRRLQLVVDVPPGPVVVSGDDTRLAQVLGNLLHNAAKFTPAGGRVTLSLHADGGEALIHVHDTGPGIAPDLLPSLFQPFTQAKQTLARSEGGLGLGLALVRGIVGLHGGRVAVTDPGPGGGADFAIALPRVAPRPEAVAVDRSGGSTASPTRHHVLVIDDNRDAADSLAQLVCMFGHSAEVAYDAIVGLRKAVDVPPDVVLCDIGLPGMDGYEFARRFRALPAHRPVRLVALSGYAQPDDVARAAAAGFDAHIAKPADPDRLASLLR